MRGDLMRSLSSTIFCFSVAVFIILIGLPSISPVIAEEIPAAGINSEDISADRMERPKEPIADLQEELSAIEEAEAEFMLSQIKAIIKSGKSAKSWAESKIKQDDKK